VEFEARQQAVQRRGVQAGGVQVIEMFQTWTGAVIPRESIQASRAEAFKQGLRAGGFAADQAGRGCAPVQEAV